MKASFFPTLLVITLFTSSLSPHTLNNTLSPLSLSEASPLFRLGAIFEVIKHLQQDTHPYRDQLVSLQILEAHRLFKEHEDLLPLCHVFYTCVRSIYLKAAVLGDVLTVIACLDCMDKTDTAMVPQRVKEAGLFNAAQEDHRDVIEVLIQRGIDINSRMAKGLTPLMAAAYAGHYHAMHLLLSLGADATLTTEDGKTYWDLFIRA